MSDAIAEMYVASGGDDADGTDCVARLEAIDEDKRDLEAYGRQLRIQMEVIHSSATGHTVGSANMGNADLADKILTAFGQKLYISARRRALLCSLYEQYLGSVPPTEMSDDDVAEAIKPSSVSMQRRAGLELIHMRLLGDHVQVPTLDRDVVKAITDSLDRTDHLDAAYMESVFRDLHTALFEGVGPTDTTELVAGVLNGIGQLIDKSVAAEGVHKGDMLTIDMYQKAFMDLRKNLISCYTYVTGMHPGVDATAESIIDRLKTRRAA